MKKSEAVITEKKLVPNKAPMQSFVDLVRETWSTYNRHGKLLIGISFIINLSSVIALLFHQIYLFTTAFTVVAFHTVFNLASIVTSVWGGLALYAVVCFPERVTSIKQAFKIGGPFFLASFTTGLLTFLWILLGFVLLIVPGIYWGILYGLAVFVVFKEGLNNRSALERSKQLVKPYWLGVLGRQIGLILLIGIPLSIVLFGLAFGFHALPTQMNLLLNDVVGLVINILLFPISLLFLSAIYSNLVALHKRRETASQK